MILRRLAKSIRRHDWFTVWIEMFAVVFGVFFALQVDRWNEWRKERNEERDYLIRLSSDIDRSVAQSRGAIGYMEDLAERGAVVLSSLEGCSIDPADEGDFASGLHQLGNIVPPYLADGTIEEMRSTGKQSVIRSTDLRRELANLLAHRRYVSSFYQNMFDRITPHKVYVDSRFVYTRPQILRGGKDIPLDAIQFDLNALCQDTRFYRSVAAARAHTYDALFWNKVNLRSLESLAETLDNELKRLGIEKGP